MKKNDAFFSHNSQDKHIVEKIAQWLEDKTNLSVWLDKWNLIPGDPWQEEIEKALDESENCVVFLGSSGIGPWQNEEMRSALDEKVLKKTIRVIPVLLPGARRPREESKIPRFLRRLTWVIFEDSWNEEGALHRLVCGIKDIPPGRRKIKAKINTCPFRGLEVFREDDKDFFFGREAVVQLLIEKLSYSRFLAITGPSGCGKSSVVQAGLIPHLREEALVTLITPSERPIEELAFALRKFYPENKRPLVEKLIDRLMERSENLHLVAREILENSDKKKLILVIDQFEEIFTQICTGKERSAFILLVVNAIEMYNGPVISILTMRSDFMSKCSDYPDLNTYMSENFFQVERMNREELRHAVEVPARMVGFEFENGLVKRILDDVKGSPGELPLIQHALLELYNRSEDTKITFLAYNEIGGIGGALVKQAESLFDNLDEDRKEILRKMFVLHLIQPGEEVENMRRRATKEDLLSIGDEREAVEDVLNRLSEARLVTIYRDTFRQQDFVDVAHEALIRKWDRIQTWMSMDREAARQIGVLRRDSAEWEREDKNSDYLYHDARLAQMENLLKSNGGDLIETEIRFIRDGIKLRQQKSRQKRIIKQFIIIIGVIAIFMAILFFIQKKRTERQYQKAVSNRLAAESGLKLPEDNIKALRFAEVAYKIGRPHPSSSVQKWLSKVAYSSYERPFYSESMQHEDKIISAIFSPKGNKVLTLSMDKTAKLWDLQGNLLTELKHSDYIISAVFSPDGSRILITSRDHTARLWKISGKLLADMAKHKAQISSTVFSPDGNSILTASWDNTAKLWDLQGNLLADLNKHTDKVWSAAFSPNGSRIITRSDDNTAKLWDLQGNFLADLNQHTAYISSAVFSPDGSKVLTASWDNTAKFWNLEGKLIADLDKHEDYVWSAVFSPDGKKILTASSDRTAKLWDLKGNIIANLGIHPGQVNSAVFSPDGTKILTGSGNSARIWDLHGRLLADISEHPRDVKNAAFSPDSKNILTYSENSAKLWDLNGRLAAHLTKHTDNIASAVFSPDGYKILTSSWDNTAKLWNLRNQLLSDLFKVPGGFSNAAISPDRDKIFTWSGKIAKLWDMNGNLLADLKGHAAKLTNALFSPEGDKILTASWDNSAKLWDQEGILLASLNKHKAQVVNVAFSPDGSKILTSSWDNTAKLWDLQGNLLQDLNKHTDYVTSAVFSPDGKKIVTTSEDYTAKLWDLQGNLQADLKGHTHFVTNAFFSPDSSKIVTTSDDDTAKLWNLNGGILANLKGHTGDIKFAAFSSDGAKIVTTSNDDTAKLWDIKGRLLADLNQHTDDVTSAVFSPDGDRIITTSSDNTAKLWDLQGNLLADLDKHTNDVLSAVFSSDGSRIITISRDGTVKSWYTPEAIIKWLETAPIPELSKEEKERLGIMHPDYDIK
jgi:WD40 repeat protein/energy-coupling factor transporter ATP-binding protein EcfA2